MTLVPRVLTPSGRHERRLRATDSLLRRIRGEYLEMPGLKITLEQAARLWGLDGETCRRLLSRLVDDGFLVCSVDGAYRKSDMTA